MHNSRRSKTLIEADQHSLEFSSGQLIMAICALLVLCLLCFLTGVVAGKLEFGSSVAQVEEVDASDGSAPANATKSQSNGKPEQSSGAPSTKSAPEATKTEPAKPKTPPRVVDRPSPQSPPAVAPVPPAEATKPTDVPTATQVAKTEDSGPKWIDERPEDREATSPAKGAAKPETTKTETAAAASKPVETPKETPAAQPAKEEKKEDDEAPAAASTKGNFTIQVAAYQAKNKRLAEDYVKSLKDKDGVTADMVKSKDGKYYQILVGRYPDRAAAEKAQKELKKKAGFAECIVKVL